MPKKKVVEDKENEVKTSAKKINEKKKIAEASKKNSTNKKAKKETKESSKKLLVGKKEAKKLPKPEEKKSLPKAKEKKLFPKKSSTKALPEKLTEEEKDLKLLEKIKEFFGKNPEKSSKLDDEIDQKDYLPEYYDLPYRYNETVVKILAQTPKRLFIYWDISDYDIEKYRRAFGDDFFEKTYPILLVHNEELNYTYEVPINDFANSWYLDIKDSKSKYTVQLGRKFKEVPNFAEQTKQIVQEENINLQNDYIEITNSNTLETPNDHVLFENLKPTVLYRNVKTYEETTKNISNLFNGLAKVYNVYDLYKIIYKDEIEGDMFDITNPSSAGNPSSSMSSSFFRI